MNYLGLRPAACGLRPRQQALVHGDGHSYDRLDANLATAGKPVSLYFNIDKPWNSLELGFKR